MSSGMSKPPLLGLVRRQQLTPVRPSRANVFAPEFCIKLYKDLEFCNTALEQAKISSECRWFASAKCDCVAKRFNKARCVFCIVKIEYSNKCLALILRLVVASLQICKYRMRIFVNQRCLIVGFKFHLCNITAHVRLVDITRQSTML